MTSGDREAGETLLRAQRKVIDPLAANVLSNAMLHVSGFWYAAYGRSPLEKFFEQEKGEDE